MYKLALTKLEIQMILACMTEFNADLAVFDKEVTKEKFDELFLKISNKLKE